MSTTTPEAADALDLEAEEDGKGDGRAQLPVHKVAVAEASGFAASIRATKIVWQRELIRFGRSKLRLITSFAQPILYLFVFGTGLSSFMRGSGVGFDFRKFLFPGIVAMSVLFSAVFSAVSIVWDREFGFLREMLVAPVPRSGIVIGKAFGGATVATLQGALVLLLAPLIGMGMTPLILVESLLIMALLAFTLTSLGIVVASRMQRIESFQAVMQFFLMPMFFLSGALFPIAALPKWLGFLVRLNPMTYGVVALRRVMFSGSGLGEEASQAAGLKLAIGGIVLPTWALLLIVLAFGVGALVISVFSFRNTE